MGEIYNMAYAISDNEDRASAAEELLAEQGIENLRDLGRELIPSREAVKPALRELTDWKNVNLLYRSLVGSGIARPLRSSETEDGELPITSEERIPIFRFLLSRKLGKQSRWAYYCHLMRLFDCLDVEPTEIEKVTREDVVSFFREEETRRAGNTVRSRASVSFQFFQWAEKTGRIPEDPAAQLKPSNFGN